MKYIEYHERKKHGTFDFPVEFYHVTPSHPRYEMTYHWHMECELIRVLKGQFLMTMEDKEFLIRAGDLAFVPSGALHGGIPSSCVYECIVFDLHALAKSNTAGKKLLGQVCSNAVWVNSCFPDTRDDLHRIVWTLFDTMRNTSAGRELIITGAIYQFFGCVFERHYYTERPLSSRKNHRRMEQLRAVFDLIDDRYADCLTLEDLARTAGMNPRYFCRFFQEMTHRTPIDYLNYYRIEQACFKLVTSDESVTEIALSCGFNDVSYFSKTFKKYKGLTPRKYLRLPLQ